MKGLPRERRYYRRFGSADTSNNVWFGLIVRTKRGGRTQTRGKNLETRDTRDYPEL